MSSLQLITYFALSEKDRENLPEIVNDHLRHKCASLIQKKWRKSWLYRNNFIRSIILSNAHSILTARCCHRFIFYNHFKEKTTILEMISFVHRFFYLKNDNKYQLPIEERSNFFLGLSAMSGDNLHDFFCLVNKLVTNSITVDIQWEHFHDFMSIFPKWMIHDMVEYLCKN